MQGVYAAFLVGNTGALERVIVAKNATGSGLRALLVRPLSCLTTLAMQARVGAGSGAPKRHRG
jgi:hypothetical protein